MILQDFRCIRGEDQVLVVNLVNAQPIGGWTVQFQVGKRLGWSSGLITKSAASGYGGASGSPVSGIAITNSGLGELQIRLTPADTSGLDDGSYPFILERTDSGYATVLTQGFLVLNR